MSDLKNLCNRLTDIGYHAIFRHPGNEAVIDTLWDNREKRGNMEALVTDNTLSWLCRFIASEILFKKDVTFLYRISNKVLADVYLHAALENYSGQMSDWGFRLGPDDLGDLGKRIIIFEDASLENWRPYLTDDRKITYIGFLEQVYHHDDYRIKDIACLYLIHLKRLSFVLEGDAKERDKVIEQVSKQF